MKEVEKLREKISDFWNILPKEQIQNFSKENILELERFEGEWIYDLKDFLNEVSEKNSLDKHFNAIEKQWDHTVIYSGNTPFMIQTINLEKCNGISTYIPSNIHESEIIDYYKTLSWYKMSGYEKIFSDY